MVRSGSCPEVRRRPRARRSAARIRRAASPKTRPLVRMLGAWVAAPVPLSGGRVEPRSCKGSRLGVARLARRRARSVDAQRAGAFAVWALLIDRDTAGVLQRPGDDLPDPPGRAGVASDLDVVRRHVLDALDRKSTRLNSSH